MISSTQIFQSLVETSAFLNGEDLGPDAGTLFDHQLGKFNALLGLKQKIGHDELLARANTIQIYCGSNALQAYCHELEDVEISTPYAFDDDGNEHVDREHEGMKFLAVMDIYGMAKTGAQLGWKPGWCPFRGPAETLWHAGFLGDKFHPVVKGAEVLLGQRIAKFHGAAPHEQVDLNDRV